MKKLSVALFFIALAVQGFAQEDESNIRFGLTLSPQVSWMTAGDGNIENNGAVFGFCYGLLMDVKIPKNYAFATGIIVSYDGGKLGWTDSTKFNSFPDRLYPAGTNVEYHLQYVEIPLTLRLMTNQIGYITYFGQFGLQAGFNFRSRAGITTPTGAEDESRVNFGSDVTPFNIGLLVGGGFEYEITGNTALTVSLQYFNGFIDVTDDPKEYKVHSGLNHLRLGLGVFF